MKKILFLINTLDGGGAEKVLVDLLNELCAFDKYRIDLLTICGGVHSSKLSSKVNHRAIVKGNRLFSRLVKRIIYHMPPKVFRALFIKEKYDLEIAYLEGFPTRVVAESEGNKICLLHCDVSVKPVLQRFYVTKEKCLREYSKFNKVCMVSERVRDGFFETFGELDNAIIMHNVIDGDAVIQKSNEVCDFEWKTKGVRILSAGRLSPEKGYDRLVKAAAELEREYDFEICILGDGSERARLEKLISELGVSSVRLLGYTTNPYTYMKKSDLFVSSSLYEGYSTVVAECMILKLPVLTTECAGMRELLDNGKYGIIVENSQRGIVDGLKTVLSKHSAVPDIKAALLGGQHSFGAGKYIDLIDEITN